MDLTKNLKLIIFDFDGTLYDLAIDWDRAKQLAGVRTNESLGQAIERHKLERNVERLESLMNLEKQALAGQNLDQGIVTLLNSVARKYKVAVFSRNSSKAISDFLERSGVYADMVVGREEVVRLKPDPEGIKLILTRFKLLPSQALLVGDTWHDVEVARNAGLKSAIVGDAYQGNSKKTLKPDFHYSVLMELLKAL